MKTNVNLFSRIPCEFEQENKPGEIRFPKIERNLPKVLTFFQTIYLSWHKNVCVHQVLCNNIRLSRVTIVLPDANVAVISLYESVTNLTFLDEIVQNWCRRQSEIYAPVHLLDSELGLPICRLFLGMRAPQCQDVTPSVLFHILKR